MAKTKKKEELTLEEKLENALVPVEEQPYQVPENWCWVRLKELCDNVIVPQRDKPKKFDGNIPWCRIEDIEGKYLNGTLSNQYVTEETIEAMNLRVCPKGTVICSCSASLGIQAILTRECCTNQTFIGLVCNDLVLYNEYLYYYLMSLKQYFQTIGTGTTIKYIERKKFEELKIPFPNFNEQQRIVERIESLFAKLDEAKEKIKEVAEKVEERKATILQKAFEGELTVNWRKENNIKLNEWRKKTIKECCLIGSGGTPSRKNSEYYMGSIPWIKTGEINWNYIYDSEEKISEDALANSSAKLYKAESVLIAMYGMGITRGRAAILKVPAATNQAVCVLQPEEYLDNKFLYYFFMCNYWDIRACAIGGNQLNLSATIIGKLNIDIPTIQEQREIVMILDGFIEKENRVSELVEKALEQIEVVKKSILAKAFCGELGTNNPDEESAIELLKEILEKS